MSDGRSGPPTGLRTLLIAFLASILSLAAGLAALYRGIDKAVDFAFNHREKSSSPPARVTFEPGPKLWDWEVDFEGSDIDVSEPCDFQSNGEELQ